MLVSELSYEQLKSYNFAANFTALAGSRPYADSSQFDPARRDRLVPARHAYLFDRYPDTYYILELKDTVDAGGPDRADQAVEELIRLIREYRMEDRVVVSSFDDEGTFDFRSRTRGNIPTGAATMDTRIVGLYGFVGELYP